MKCHTWMDSKAVVEAVREAALPRLAKCAMLIEREAKKSMKQGGKMRAANTARGRAQIANVYYNKAVKRWVVASRPGTPPHAQTKILRNSITHARYGKMGYIIGPTTMAWYGRLHEFGGKHHPPRPFMRPALYMAIKQMPELFRGLKLRYRRRGEG